jgi:type IV secretory pathway TrbD component
VSGVDTAYPRAMEPEPPALPTRPARPLVVHALVDVAVAFLALVLLLWILGVSIWVTVVASVVAGLAAAPLTRAAEERALARREHDGAP